MTDKENKGFCLYCPMHDDVKMVYDKLNGHNKPNYSMITPSMYKNIPNMLPEYTEKYKRNSTIEACEAVESYRCIACNWLCDNSRIPVCRLKDISFEKNPMDIWHQLKIRARLEYNIFVTRLFFIIILQDYEITGEERKAFMDLRDFITVENAISVGYIDNIRNKLHKITSEYENRPDEAYRYLYCSMISCNLSMKGFFRDSLRHVIVYLKFYSKKEHHKKMNAIIKYGERSHDNLYSKTSS